MKGHSVSILTGLIALAASHSVAALAIVESRTGEPSAYDETASRPLPIARSFEDRATRAPVSKVQASAEDRAALLGLKHLEHLKQEISELRGLLETQDHEIQRLKKSQQDLYSDLDKRIINLSAAKSSAVSKTASKTSVVVTPSPTPVVTKKSSITIVPTGIAVPTPVSREPAQKTIEEPTAFEDSTEKTVYEAAYNLVRTKRYTEATSAFQNYLSQFKTGEHAANAHYWVGEIAMLEWQKDPENKTLLDKAAHAFSNVAFQFPGNPKVPDALLKLGIIESEKGNATSAQKYFTDLKSRYPGSAAARIAETRLKQLSF